MLQQAMDVVLHVPLSLDGYAKELHQFVILYVGMEFSYLLKFVMTIQIQLLDVMQLAQKLNLAGHVPQELLLQPVQPHVEILTLFLTLRDVTTETLLLVTDVIRFVELSLIGNAQQLSTLLQFVNRFVMTVGIFYQLNAMRVLYQDAYWIVKTYILAMIVQEEIPLILRFARLNVLIQNCQSN